jgi:putative transposase
LGESRASDDQACSGRFGSCLSEWRGRIRRGGYRRIQGKWSAAFRQTLADAGIRVVQTPFQAPNCNAHAERFVRSIKEECLDHVIILGDAHLRRMLTAFMAHYHQERNHQGLHDRLIAPAYLAPPVAHRLVRCRERLAGLLRYYHRAA